jgi:hypothetical protein
MMLGRLVMLSLGTAEMPDSGTIITITKDGINKLVNGTWYSEGFPDFETNTFGAAVVYKNTAVFAPRKSNCIATYSEEMAGPTCFNSTNLTASVDQFHGAAKTADVVVFAPFNAESVCTFDLTSLTCNESSPHTRAFGAAADNDGVVVMAPYDAPCVGVYNTSFECIPHTLGENNSLFSGAARVAGRNVVFAPYSAECIGVYNIDTQVLTCNPSNVTSSYAAAVAHNGTAFLLSKNCIDVYDLESDSTDCIAHSHGSATALTLKNTTFVLTAENGSFLGVIACGHWCDDTPPNCRTCAESETDDPLDALSIAMIVLGGIVAVAIIGISCTRTPHNTEIKLLPAD